MKNILQNPYLKLIRLHYSTGTFLLLLPAILGIIIGFNPKNWAEIFIPILQVSGGAFFARSAGCIINDIIDRNLDKKVQRTKNRPLAAGLLTVEQALYMLCAMLGGGFLILLSLPLSAQVLSLLFFLPTFLYPLSKYFSKFPQLFLAPLFASGTLVGFAIMQDRISLSILSFFVGCMVWVVFYDTVYAHQDKNFDQKVDGVGSMAITLQKFNFPILKNLISLSFLFWTMGSILAAFNKLVIIFYLILWYIINDKFCRTNLDKPSECKDMFDFSMIVLFLLCIVNLIANLMTNL